MSKKKIGTAVIVILALALAPESIALTSGPTLPEYTNFEPLDAPDLVDLSRGSFSYSIPLVNVPGPEMGFPVILSYHAGIGVEQEASWTGLGWNVQAGAITRQVNNIPDDYKGDHITESIVGDRDYGFGFSVGTSFVRLGAAWHNGEMTNGFVGLSFGSNTSPFGLGVDIQIGDHAGVTLSPTYTTAGGYTFGGSLGVQDGSFVGGGSVGFQHIGLNGQMSTNYEGTLSGSLGKLGITLLSNRKGGESSNTSSKAFSGNISRYEKNVEAGLFIPTTYGPIILNFSSYDIRQSSFADDSHYGFLYSDKTSMGCQPQQRCDEPGHDAVPRDAKKMELNSSALPIWDAAGSHAFFSSTAEDAYLVESQGIDGNMKPYRTEDGDYMDYLSNVNLTVKHPYLYSFPGASVFGALSSIACALVTDWCDETTTEIEYAPLFQANTFSPGPANTKTNWRNLHTDASSNIQWRFIGDPGGGLYTNPDVAGRDNPYDVSMASKKIIPFFKADGSGRLVGWEIKKEDGLRYRYTRALFNRGTTIQNSSGPGTGGTSQSQPGEYAYAWLLTAILNPDFIPVGSGGDCSDFIINGTIQSICLPKQEDIGGWVRFEYTDNRSYGWGYNGLNSYGGTLKAASINITGTKDVAYLKKIVTPTHTASFEIGDRLDGLGTGGEKLSKLNSIALSRNDDNEIISRVELDFDYSLSPGTANSSASNKGRLTLNGVKQVSGSNGPALLQDRFEYGFNPLWNRSKKDSWGFYCGQCGPSPEADNTSMAWSLTRIVDAAGKSTEIEYGSNSIEFIGEQPVVFPPNTDYSKYFRNFTNYDFNGRYFSNQYIRNNGTSLQPYYALPLAELEGPQLFNLDHVKKIPHPAPVKYLIESGPTQEFNSLPENLFVVSSEEQLESEWSDHSDEIGGAIHIQTLFYNRTDDLEAAKKSTGLVNQTTLPKGVWYGHWEGFNNLDGCAGIGNVGVDCKGTILRFAMPNSFIRIWALYSQDPHYTKLGGGPRVEKIRSTDLITGESKAIKYAYHSGSTAEMPATGSNYSLDFSYTEADGRKKFSGFPMVFYKQTVTEFENFPNGGKDEFNFVTPFDAPVHCKISNSTVHGRAVDARLEIADNSSFWGMLWKKRSLDKDENEVSSTSFSWGQDWSANSSLKSDVAPGGQAINGESLFELNSQGSFGSAQKVYSHRHLALSPTTKEICSPYQPSPLLRVCLENNGVQTTQVLMYKVNPYLRKTTSVLDGVAETEEANYFDYLTGKPRIIITQNVNRVLGTDGQVTNSLMSYVKQSKPAYLVYDRPGEMRDKNMLSQVFSTAVFKHTGDVSALSLSQLTAQSQLVSAEYTDWSDPDNSLWRMKNQYVLKKRSQFTEPGREAPGAAWLRVERNKFDKYGHVVDAENALGIHNSQLFGDGGALPMAFAQNASVDGLFSESFEVLGDLRKRTPGAQIYSPEQFAALTSAQKSVAEGILVKDQAKTGTHSIKVLNHGLSGNSTCFAFDYPPLAGRKYEVSAWYYDDSRTVGSFNPKISVSPDGTEGSKVYSVAGSFQGSNTWKKLSYRYSSSTSGTASARLCLYASQNESGADIRFDEIRMQPVGSLMSTFARDSKGNIISSTDANQTVIHYEYDAFGNLSGIRNDDGILLSEQSKRTTRPDVQYSIKPLPTFVGQCQEFQVIPVPSGSDARFQVLSISPSTAAQYQKIQNNDGTFSDFLCDQKPGIGFDVKVIMLSSGMVHSLNVPARSVPTIKIQGCESAHKWAYKIRLYDGKCYDLDHSDLAGMKYLSYFGIRLPSRDDLLPLGMSSDDVLTGYRIKFILDDPEANSPHNSDDSHYPLHIRFNWFNDIYMEDDLKYDGTNFVDRISNHVQPGRKYKMVTGGYASLGHVAETVTFPLPVEALTREELGLLRGDSDPATINEGVLIFSLYGNHAPATANGYWPYGFSLSKVKMEITPITKLVP